MSILLLYGVLWRHVFKMASQMYMHAIFKPAVQQGAEICASPPHIFSKGGLL